MKWPCSEQDSKDFGCSGIIFCKIRGARSAHQSRCFRTYNSRQKSVLLVVRQSDCRTMALVSSSDESMFRQRFPDVLVCDSEQMDYPSTYIGRCSLQSGQKSRTIGTGHATYCNCGGTAIRSKARIHAQCPFLAWRIVQENLHIEILELGSYASDLSAKSFFVISLS